MSQRSRAKRPATATARKTDAPADAVRTPLIDIAGFAGPLGLLLATARAAKIDLARLSLTDLVDQLAEALRQPESLSDKAIWLIIGAQIVELRSRLLLPPDHPERRQAETETKILRDRLTDLEAVQALAAWLEARPQFGRDVFGRGQPEFEGVAHEHTLEIDTVEFLWASVAVFQGFRADPAIVYRPRPPDLHSIPDARARILRLLRETASGLSLAELLPPATIADTEPDTDLKRCSAWSSTFVAGLELAKQGEVTMDQTGAFEPVMMVRRAD